VRPARGMHVYAPGVSGYKPIVLAIEPQRWVVVRAAQYPPSDDYHFKPLNEHVQVYQRTFRIVQDIALDASPEAQAALKDISTLTLKGALNYQACDDKICFSPQAVPLTWTVASVSWIANARDVETPTRTALSHYRSHFTYHASHRKSSHMRFQISHDPSRCRRRTLTCHDRVRGASSTPLVVTTKVSTPSP
jgi:Disulphide bond corrector protein DsbC